MDQTDLGDSTSCANTPPSVSSATRSSSPKRLARSDRVVTSTAWSRASPRRPVLGEGCVVFRDRHWDRVMMADSARGTPGRRFEEAWIDSPQIGSVGFVVARHDGKVVQSPRPATSDFVMLR